MFHKLLFRIDIASLRVWWYTVLRYDGATHFCKKYLHGYSTPELLGNHGVNCHHAQRTKLAQDSRCRFNNVQKQLPAPFVAYADFESILQPVGDGVDVT